MDLKKIISIVIIGVGIALLIYGMNHMDSASSQIVELFGKTAIVWNRITLDAIVRGSSVVTEFTVTEVYQKKGKEWKLLALTFSSVRDTHQLQK